MAYKHVNVWTFAQKLRKWLDTNNVGLDAVQINVTLEEFWQNRHYFEQHDFNSGHYTILGIRVNIMEC